MTPADDVPHYLCVFRANEDITNNVIDLGQDPDFRPPAATWGICRPDKRRVVRPGSFVVFLGYFPRAEQYLLKGWLRVGESISYLEALERFPDRPNVIIRDAQGVAGIAPVPRGWKRQDLRDQVHEKTGTSEPEFLTTINMEDRQLVQLPFDDHEIDNWKCQRMFLCRRSQLSACIDAEVCIREEEFPSLRGYIVAEAYCDLGASRLEWRAVAPRNLAGLRLRTPRHQHNPIRLSAVDMEGVLAITNPQPRAAS
jgi:hypothetical protein